MLLCAAIRVGNKLYDQYAYDEHAPSTLLFQLRMLCMGGRGDAAVLIDNEKRYFLCQWEIRPLSWLIPTGMASMVLWYC